VLRALFQETCPACDGPSPGGFCPACAAEFVRVRDPCDRCGLGRPVASCPRHASPWHLDAVVAPFAYVPPLDHYVLALKYGGARALGRALGLLLIEAGALEPPPVDALVAVPLHGARLRERGYNQALEIARTLGRALALPVLLRGIERRAGGGSQIGQTASQRRASVAGAFRIRRDVGGMRLAIVDDVLTTGATADALAAELKKAGAASCVAIAAARTP
jgi:ComF family protein